MFRLSGDWKPAAPPFPTASIRWIGCGRPQSRGFHFKQRHDLEERAATAAHTLHEIYVLTPNQSLRIVFANSWSGNVCLEYVVDDARQQSFIRYAVFEKNSKFVNYDLGQEDIEDRCSMAGTTDLKGEAAMAKIIQLIVASDLLDQIRAAAKQHEISVAQSVRAAIHRHLTESYKLNNVSKQKPEIINLGDVPVVRWSRAEQEYGDSVIRQHFEEDR